MTTLTENTYKVQIQNANGNIVVKAAYWERKERNEIAEQNVENIEIGSLGALFNLSKDEADELIVSAFFNNDVNGNDLNAIFVLPNEAIALLTDEKNRDCTEIGEMTRVLEAVTELKPTTSEVKRYKVALKPYGSSSLDDVIFDVFDTREEAEAFCIKQANEMFDGNVATFQELKSAFVVDYDFPVVFDITEVVKPSTKTLSDYSARELLVELKNRAKAANLEVELISFEKTNLETKDKLLECQGVTCANDGLYIDVEHYLELEEEYPDGTEDRPFNKEVEKAAAFGVSVVNCY